MPKCPKDCHKPNPLIFRRVIIPSALGDDKENPPENGAYCNALVIYEANNAMYLYSSDGIPTKIPTSITSYNDLTHKPSINGVELEGEISLEDLGISDLIEESVASEATARAEADEALQDAIDAEEAARIAADRDIINSIPTVNDATLTIQRNGTSVGTFTANSASDTTINVDVPIYTSGLINDSGYVTEAALSGYATDQDIENAVSAEADLRAAADQDLQTQIDAISSASDVVDVVGTYAELQDYDTSKLSNNDIIKVLTDSTHDNAISYYRWDDANDTFVYIGSQGPFYTKSETDATFVPQTRTVNGKALSTDIVLTASDVSALPASTVIPTVNNATLTIKRNGNNVASFTANSASDVSADIAVPTKTSDITNDSNFVSDANYVHTDNNFTTAEKNKLAGIAAGAEVNVQSDWNQTNSSADDYIKNKPSIPTKTSDLTNDSGYISTLPIASANTLGAIKVGTNLSIAVDGTLSADAQSITVDSALSSTSTNPVENRVINTALGAKANTADLADVATSGDYDDLLNKPTIPTVNNATLTIQRNGTTVDTFTANASQDKSVNIVVPTATSDLTNDSGFLTSIPTASASTLGGIKVGAGLSITDGVLSTTGGGVADAVEWTNVLNRPTNVSYWTNDAGYITSAALPTKTSDLTNDGSDGTSTYVEADDLATVATSGSYNDLSNKPTIPTVNDATITIQRNSATVDSFTVNASQNKSINIVVPTKTSDLTNDSNFATTSQIPTKTSDLTNDGSDGTAAYLETDETAYKTASIPYGQCDSTSTSTVYTATIPGITELRDGVCMWLKNGVVNSAANFTININNLGAKPVYSNMAAASRDTTLWNANYTMLFVYDSTRVEGGCWILYRGWNSDTNTIGYQIRTNSQSLPMSSVVYRYRLLFTSADGTHYVPANNSTSTNATSSRTVCQDKINPFGSIFYYSAAASVAANTRPAATTLWEQFAIVLGYSFNNTGAALTLTSWKPVYIKAAPQSDGSAIIDSTTPYVQDLPTTEDGKIYIFLGVAYSATNIELQLDHPVYWFKDGMIRPYTNAAAGISSVAWGDITGTLSSQTDLNTALGAKANSADLATVATSGSYNDLTNKPTIPTVNNATLTIQRNNTNVATFTANAASNVTANIEVPIYTAGAGIDITNNVISATANTFASYSNGTLYITNAAQNADTESF